METKLTHKDLFVICLFDSAQGLPHHKSWCECSSAREKWVLSHHSLSCDEAWVNWCCLHLLFGWSCLSHIILSKSSQVAYLHVCLEQINFWAKKLCINTDETQWVHWLRPPWSSVSASLHLINGCTYPAPLFYFILKWGISWWFDFLTFINKT